MRLSLAAAFAALFTMSAMAQNAPVILEYHEADPMPERGWAVSTENFRDQMRYLARSGYHVIPIADLIDFVHGRRSTLPANAVVISSDDGWRCVETVMDPILRQFGYPWSIYIYPSIVGRGSHVLSWPEIETLSNEGVDVEGHTMSHAHLTRKSHPEMSDSQYDAFLHEELDHSKEVLESHLGHSIHVLAYPYGEYDNAITAAASRAGYDAGLVGWARPNNRSTDPMKLGRLKIVSDMTLEQFSTALGAVPITFCDAFPSPGSIVAGGEQTLSASIDDHDLDPASVRATLLSDTPSAASYDPASHRLLLTTSGEFREGRQTVLIQATTKSGRRASALWRFYTSRQARSEDEAMRVRLALLPKQDEGAQGR